MADEQGTLPLDYYRFPDYIIRNYYFEDIFTTYGQKVMWIPNGYAKGVGPRNPSDLLKSSQRPNKCFYSGRMTDERRQFLNTMNQVASGHCILETTKSFGQGYPRQQFGDKLSEAVFAPCPKGNNIETIRFYDSLECGAIPVITHSPYAQMLIREFVQGKQNLTHHQDHPIEPQDRMFDEVPFVLLNDWTEFPDRVISLYNQPEKLDQMQQNAIEFWRELKRRKAQHIRRLVDASFEKYYGKGA